MLGRLSSIIIKQCQWENVELNLIPQPLLIITFRFADDLSEFQTLWCGNKVSRDFSHRFLYIWTGMTSYELIPRLYPSEISEISE